MEIRGRWRETRATDQVMFQGRCSGRSRLWMRMCEMSLNSCVFMHLSLLCLISVTEMAPFMVVMFRRFTRCHGVKMICVHGRSIIYSLRHLLIEYKCILLKIVDISQYIAPTKGMLK